MAEVKAWKRNSNEAAKQPKGNSYEGARNANGQRHGYGVYRCREAEAPISVEQKWGCPVGSVYVGEWVKDLRHGHGELTYTDGSSYVGAWYNDMKHGRGTYEWAKEAVEVGLGGGDAASSPSSRARYEGHFREGMRHGHHGALINAAGEVVYNGTWRYNWPSGWIEQWKYRWQYPLVS